MIFLHLIFAASLAAACSLAGCVIRTPDGVRLVKGNSESKVCAALGAPNMRHERMKYAVGGVDKWTYLYYVDRGYRAHLRWGRLQSVSPFEPDEKRDLQRLLRVQNEVVPLVKIGESPDDLVEQFGPPEVVDTETIQNGTRWIHRTLHGMPLTSQHGVPTGTVYLYFTAHDLFVEVQHDRVKAARGMYEHNWEQIREYLAKKGRKPRGEPRGMDGPSA